MDGVDAFGFARVFSSPAEFDHTTFADAARQYPCQASSKNILLLTGMDKDVWIYGQVLQEFNRDIRLVPGDNLPDIRDKTDEPVLGIIEFLHQVGTAIGFSQTLVIYK
jgi:hypothetical protein